MLFVCLVIDWEGSAVKSALFLVPYRLFLDFVFKMDKLFIFGAKMAKTMVIYLKFGVF